MKLQVLAFTIIQLILGAGLSLVYVHSQMMFLHGNFAPNMLMPQMFPFISALFAFIISLILFPLVVFIYKKVFDVEGVYKRTFLLLTFVPILMFWGYIGFLSSEFYSLTKENIAVMKTGDFISRHISEDSKNTDYNGMARSLVQTVVEKEGVPTYGMSCNVRLVEDSTNYGSKFAVIIENDIPRENLEYIPASFPEKYRWTFMYTFADGENKSSVEQGNSESVMKKVEKTSPY